MAEKMRREKIAEYQERGAREYKMKLYEERENGNSVIKR